MNQQADAAGFMVLYPQQSMARQAQRCWRWFQPTRCTAAARPT